MNDERKIVIEVVLKGGDGGGGDTTPSPVSPTDETKEKATKGIGLATSVLMNQFYEQAKATIKNVATYEIGKYFNLTENYMQETDMQNTLTTIGKVASLGTTIWAGAKLGSVGGVGGSVAGALIGAGGWVGNEIYSMYQKAEQQQMQLNANNYDLEFKRTRMGLTDNGRGTLN